MIVATSVAYDVVFVVHVLAAVAALAVFLTMRIGARSVAVGAPAATQRQRVPDRRNWAARVIHLSLLSGLYLSSTGGHDVSFSRPWVGVGLACYVLAAGHLEFRLLPFERRVAREIAADGTAPAAEGRRLTISVDTVLALVAIALVSMLIQY